MRTSQERYEELIDELLGTDGVTPPPGGSGFGRGSMRYQRKIFAMLVRGRLVVKLPAARVDELLAAGHGDRFDANKGTPMKEWFSLDPESSLEWLALAREALDFARASAVLGGMKLRLAGAPRRGRRPGALFLCAIVVLLASCGSSSSSGTAGSGSGSPGSSSPPAESAQPTGAPSTGGGLSPRAAPSAPACTTAGLKVTLGPPNGAAGSVYLAIDFTNTTSVTCSLYGYPGVSLAGGNPPAQIGAAAARNPAIAPSLVTLPAGGVAHATLQVTQAGNYPSATCDPAPATTLVVYPPGQTASASVPYTATGCKATAITILHVEVVQPGS